MDCNIETIFLQSTGIIRKEPENPVPNGFPIDNHTEREVLYIEPFGYDINYHRNRSSSLVCRDD